uniref:hypothetical protein n=1 Tax=Pseudomonas aeruginosa TaxID=287 RepID=UPI000938F45E
MTKAIYYHAGCAICVEAERSLLPLLDHKQVDIEVVHLAEQSARIAEAEKAGVRIPRHSDTQPTLIRTPVP